MNFEQYIESIHEILDEIYRLDLTNEIGILQGYSPSSDGAVIDWLRDDNPEDNFLYRILQCYFKNEDLINEYFQLEPPTRQ